MKIEKYSVHQLIQNSESSKILTNLFVYLIFFYKVEVLGYLDKIHTPKKLPKQKPIYSPLHKQILNVRNVSQSKPSMYQEKKIKNHENFGRFRVQSSGLIRTNYESCLPIFLSKRKKTNFCTFFFSFEKIKTNTYNITLVTKIGKNKIRSLI